MRTFDGLAGVLSLWYCVIEGGKYQAECEVLGIHKQPQNDLPGGGVHIYLYYSKPVPSFSKLEGEKSK